VTIRVVLAEDNLLLREGIRGLVEAQLDMAVVAACADLDGLLRAVDELAPHVVVIDIRMPPTHTDEGIRAVEHCRRQHAGTGVLVLSDQVTARYVRALVDQGTGGRGYLLKERIAAVDDLTAAIRTVAGGGSAFDPNVIDALVRAQSPHREGELSALSAREREVLGEMAQGYSNAAIATSLVITRRAVEKHINSIFAKLQVGRDDSAHPRVRAVLAYLLGRAPRPEPAARRTRALSHR
jgi:DNA-binding NarL/FixJ family response regulator